MNAKLTPLPLDVFEAVVNALAEALVQDYRTRWNSSLPSNNQASLVIPAASALSPWLTVKEAPERARCGVKTLYHEVKTGRLRAVRVGGRRSVRFRAEWIDAWLERT